MKKEIVEKIWNRQVSSYVDAIHAARYAIKNRHDNMMDIDYIGLAIKAIRELRSVYAEYHMSMHDWHNNGLREPREMARELTGAKIKIYSKRYWNE